jgi:phosphoribosylamine--glycine ligase
MKILVIGSGGREHTIVWKLAQSDCVDKIFCAPGNAGILKNAECVDINVSEIEKLADFAESNKIDLTIVGPEVPLCEGLTDVFLKRNLKVFGPASKAAQLEGSKSFSKDFMNKYGIPTADSATFTNKDEAAQYIRNNISKAGIVVKADGLAAGKGVIVAETLQEALDGLEQCFSGSFGAAGTVVVVEELLIGEEASILALTDGNTIIPLASSQDHKRAYDGDKGPNTGGMGAYSPAPIVTEELFHEISELVLKPFLNGIQNEKMNYKGIIYAGIMVTEAGPKVLEFNVRFGDPETQAVLMRMKSDLAEVMMKTAEGKLNEVKLEWTEDPAVCIVIASGGYPGTYEKGFEIKGIDKAESNGAVVFHAGTTIENGSIVNTGGRVLGVTALGADIEKAVEKAYQAVKHISWNDSWYRKDIAKKALRQ